MCTRPIGLLTGALALSGLAFANPAAALSMKECSAKYKAEKEAGTLTAKSWNEFRKAECGADAAPEARSAKASRPKTKRSSEYEYQPTAADANEPRQHGLSMKECGEKYRDAKASGSLGGATWNEFRKAECSADAAPAAKSAKAPKREARRSSEYQPTAARDMPPDANESRQHGLTMKECGKKYRAAKASGSLGGSTWNEFRKLECGVDAAALPDTVQSGAAIFPKNIARRYADLSAGKARRKTCLDQYRANKAAGENGGLKWIEKGGGYYSECNRILRQTLGNAQ